MSGKRDWGEKSEPAEPPPDDPPAHGPLLSKRQRDFVRYYQETGNATEAARRAGYAPGGDEVAWAVQGSRLLRTAKVAAALAKEDEPAEQKHRKTRAEIRQWWASVMDGEVTDIVDALSGPAPAPPKLRDRIKASELLARTKGMFIERMANPDGSPLGTGIAEAIGRAIASARGAKAGRKK